MSRGLRRVWILGIAALLSVPVSAAAATLTFQPPTTGPESPNQSDLENLDHLYMYAWRIQGLNNWISSTTTITSVTLTISNVRNWNSDPNHLFMHLLDTTKTNGGLTQIGNNAITGGTDNGFANGTQVKSAATAGSSQVYRYQDNPGDNSMIDDFARDDNGSISGSLWQTSAGSMFLGTSNGVGNIALGSDEDNPADTATNAASGWIDYGNGMVLYSGWADENTTGGYSADGRVSGITSSSNTTYSTFKSFDTTGNTYTYSFSAAEILKLRDFVTTGNLGGSGINSGVLGDIAIALDPDCHFFNDGITLTIDYQNGGTGNPVPEPASLLMLGSGLAGLAGWHRRRQRRGQQSVPTK